MVPERGRGGRLPGPDPGPRVRRHPSSGGRPGRAAATPPDRLSADRYAGVPRPHAGRATDLRHLIGASAARRARLDAQYPTPLRQGTQSPGEPVPGAGPIIGGPDQMSSRPQDRSTRTPSPCAQPAPLDPAVADTSPGCTVIEARTRPLGERASTLHGRAGSSPTGVGSRSAPGENVPTNVPFTSSVTVSVVPLAMLTPGKKPKMPRACRWSGSRPRSRRPR